MIKRDKALNYWLKSLVRQEFSWRTIAVIRFSQELRRRSSKTQRVAALAEARSAELRRMVTAADQAIVEATARGCRRRRTIQYATMATIRVTQLAWKSCRCPGVKAIAINTAAMHAMAA